MNELAYIFERLELSQYLENFIEEGFDTWDTVLYITESDLDALNVKLGHRRKLQREIAHARGLPFEQLLAQSSIGTIAGSTSNVDRPRGSTTPHHEGHTAPPAGPAKRKYRRHPKPDENAPERPPSAYVIFSNQIREEIKPQKLSFTEIAKTVGERWQALSPDDKEPYETQANAAKDSFNREMAKYKKTTHYREYMQYLADFRAKIAGPSGGKRTRLEKDFSRASSGSGGSPVEGALESTGSSGPRRPPLPSAPSGSSTSSASPTSNVPPGVPPPRPPTASPTGATRPHLPRIIPLDPRDSPPMPSVSPHAPEPHLLSRSNLRRTTGTPTPSFLRQDTSKSSVSSNISGSTGSSSQFTPITPIDEGAQHRHSHGSHTGPVLPPLTQPLPPPSGYIQSPPPLHYHASSIGTAPPLKRLSLDDEPPDRSIPRPRSNPPDSASSDVPAPFSPHSPHHGHQHRMSASSMADRPLPMEPERERERDRDREKMDPLSVLALAGNMMDRRPGQGPGPGHGGERRRERPS